MHSQGMATWDPEPQAPHLKAWLEQTSALGEEGELPRGGRWPRIVDCLMSLVTGQGQAAKNYWAAGGGTLVISLLHLPSPTLQPLPHPLSLEFPLLGILVLEYSSFSSPLPLALKLLKSRHKSPLTTGGLALPGWALVDRMNVNRMSEGAN